jgi:hypothetical protein
MGTGSERIFLGHRDTHASVEGRFTKPLPLGEG